MRTFSFKTLQRIASVLVFFTTMPTLAAPRLAKLTSYGDGETDAGDVGSYDDEDGADSDEMKGHIVKALLMYAEGDAEEDADAILHRPRLIPISYQQGRQSTELRSSPYQWVAGLDVAGGARSTTLGASSQAAVIASGSAAVSRMLDSRLVAGAGGETQWGEFIGTDRLWSTNIHAMLQADLENARVSVNPFFSYRALEGKPFSETPGLSFSYTRGTQEFYGGASISVMSYRSLDERYSYLTGAITELKVYAGAALDPGLKLKSELTLDQSSAGSESAGAGLGGAYRFDDRWTLALDLDLGFDNIGSQSARFMSANAQLSYVLNPGLSVYLAQVYARNDGPAVFNAAGEPSLNESRSMVGISMGFGSLN